MALALKDAYQIRVVAAFQAPDGTKFHDAAEAQDFTRRKMLEAAIGTAVTANPQFARLDKGLLTEFLLMTGKHVGAVMAEPLTPVNSYQKMEPSQVKVSVAEAPAVLDKGEMILPKATVAKVERTDQVKWGDHPLAAANAKPLTQAMAAVDDGEMERQVEDDIAAALKIGGH